MRFAAVAFILVTSALSQPAFEVASIKPRTSNEIGGVYTYPGGRVEIRGCTLQQMIEQALNIQAFEMTGGPAWIQSDRFDGERNDRGVIGSKEANWAGRPGAPDRF